MPDVHMGLAKREEGQTPLRLLEMFLSYARAVFSSFAITPSRM